MQMWYNPFSPVRVWLEVRLYSRRGKLIFDHKQPVRSFVANWTKALYGITYRFPDDRVIKVVTRTGVERDYPNLYSDTVELFRFTSIEGARTGILFGNGTTAPSMNDYDLEALIPHGTGSGQLYYNATETAYDIESDRGRLIVLRTAYNKSGGDITVSEVGLFFYWKDNDGNANVVLILRDVLDPAVVVANGQAIEGRYVFEFLL